MARIKRAPCKVCGNIPINRPWYCKRLFNNEAHCKDVFVLCSTQCLNMFELNPLPYADSPSYIIPKKGYKSNVI